MSEHTIAVECFLNEATKINMDNFITKEALYKEYVKWVNKEDMFVLPHCTFAKAVYKKLFKISPKDARDTHSRKRVWRNISFKNDFIVAENS